MRYRLLGLIAILGLVLLLVGTVQAQLRSISEGQQFDRPIRTLPDHDNDNDNEGNEGLGFGKKIAGGWLGTGSFSVDLGCDGTFDIGPIPFTDAQSFGVAGHHVVTNAANPFSGHGTWTKTGHREISGRDTSFSVNATTGVLDFWSIVSFTYDFDPTFTSAITTFGAKVYLPTQNPLDPSELPVACSLGSHDSFLKVTATE